MAKPSKGVSRTEHLALLMDKTEDKRETGVKDDTKAFDQIN